MIIYSPTFTGSVQITGSQTVTGDLTVQGNLTAQTFILSSSVSYFTESFASGSTRFGDSMDDTMKVTGSLLLTGSMFINTVTAQNAASNRGNLTINGATSILNLATGDTNAGYLYHGGTDLLLVNAKNGAMQFYTNDTERMRITSGGNLQLTGSANFSSSVTSVGLLLNTGGYLGTRSIRAASDLLIFYGGTSGFNFTDSTNSTVLASISNAGAATFVSSVTAAGATFSGTTAVASAAGTSQMCIDRSGTVARIQNYDNGQAANISLAYDGGSVRVGGSSSNMGSNVIFSAGSSGTFSVIAKSTDATTYDTGISINQGASGMTALLLASSHYNDGVGTRSAVYIITFYYNGNNAPAKTYYGGNSDFVTFGVSGTNTLTLTSGGQAQVQYTILGNR